jgi:antitoxin component of MazEF toxin-antitoxin module
MFTAASSVKDFESLPPPLNKALNAEDAEELSVPLVNGNIVARDVYVTGVFNAYNAPTAAKSRETTKAKNLRFFNLSINSIVSSCDVM